MARIMARLVLGALTVVFIVMLTSQDSPKLSIVLRNRAAPGLLLLMLGVICVFFKAPALSVCSFLGRLTKLSGVGGKGTGAQQLTSAGRWALGTGFATVLVSGTIFTAVYVNNCCLGARCHETIRIHELVPGCGTPCFSRTHTYKPFY